MIEVCNALYDKTLIVEWPYNAISIYKNLRSKLSARKLDFEIIKPLRIHIKKMYKKFEAR